MNEQSHINDGGPAFPMPAHHDSQAGRHHVFCAGMSLRDWFAGQALSGLLSHPKCGDVSNIFRIVAMESYKVADAMIAARNQR